MIRFSSILILLTSLVTAIFFVSAAAYPQDYLIELFDEYYQEKPLLGGGETKVYHSWQVKTRFGNKVIVLVGDDYAYRTWLRNLTHHHKTFIIKVPDNGDNKFKFDKAVLVNIQQVHAVSDRWGCSGCRGGSPPARPAPSNTAE